MIKEKDIKEGYETRVSSMLRPDVLARMNAVKSVPKMVPRKTPGAALPKEWSKDKFKQIEEGLLHPRKQSRVINRRDITGSIITRNIQNFNSPIA